MNLNNIRAVIKKNITKEEFLNNYFKEFGTSSDESQSIQPTNEDQIVGAIFDAIDTNPDGKIDEKEYNALMNIDIHDGENGENILSDKDILGVYQKMADDIKKTYDGKTPEQAYNTAKSNNVSDSAYLDSLSFQIDVLYELIDARTRTSEETIKQFKNRIEGLIIGAKNVNTKLKVDYLKEIEKKQNYEKRAKKYAQNADIQKKKMETVEHWIKLVNIEIADIEKTGKYEDKKKAKEDELESLNNELGIYTSQYNDAIKNQKDSLADAKRINASKYLDKIKSKDKITASKIKDFENKIEAEKQSSENEIRTYQNQIDQLEMMRDYAIEQIMSSGDSGFVDYFGEEDTSGIITSELSDAEVKERAKPIAAKWRKKYANAAKLSDEFYEGVVKIASNVKCDPEALLGVMMSECGLNPKAQNSKGGASGLIQFMPRTARDMFNMSTDQIRNMSAEKQLGLVQTFLQKNKKSAGFKDSDILNAGTLYTLVFLPAYAKRDLLTIRGEKFYNANVGLDVDHDNKITKKDMSQRVLKYI